MSHLSGAPRGRLRAVLRQPRELHYSADATALRSLDLPLYVRAASALRRWQGWRVVLQDDVLALALLDDAALRIEPFPLPAPDGVRTFDIHRGNRDLKPDLEAAVALPDGRLLLLGSGTRPTRERIFLIAADASVRCRDAHDLYAMLRAARAFAGAALNLEGAAVRGDRLLLLQRGALSAGATPDAAVGELSLPHLLAWLDTAAAAPPLLRQTALRMGAADDVPYGATDLCCLPDGRVAVLACAEQAADVLTDGPVRGCRFALLEDSGVRCADILEESGRPCTLKLEGIEPRPDGHFDVVADPDDPQAPAVLALLEVHGL